MMDPTRLHDLICRGMGNAARVIGEDYDLYRPQGAEQPLSHANRIMKLPVILDDLASAYRRLRNAEEGIRATFDSISTLPGDYLRGPRGVLFVAAVPQRERPICILTTTSVDVLRSRGPGLAGLNGYGGVNTEALDQILTNWPVRVSTSTGGQKGELPADRSRSALKVLFPLTPVEIKAADLLRDDQGHQFIITSVESTPAGWRISARGSEV